MTREKQIDEFAYSQVDCEFFDARLYEGIITGAKWADEHPKPGMVNKEEFMERACDYLQAVLEHDLGYYGAIDFANNFRKSMEE